MSSFLFSHVTPIDAASDYDQDSLAAVHDIVDPDAAVWLVGDHEQTVFLCRSPSHALEWLCANSTRDALLAAVRRICSEHETPAPTPPTGYIPPPPDADAIAATQDNNAARTQDDNAAHDTVAPKRKRKGKGDGAGARQTNKRIANQRVDSWISWFRNTQDEEESAAVPAYNEENARYGVFLGAQPGAKNIGLDRASEMIHTAYIVAGYEALEDWQKVMRVWRRNYADLQAMDTVPPNRQLALTQVDTAGQTAGSLLHSRNGTVILQDSAGLEWKTL
ncbi:hypothetical protein K504DRAFT_509087, partial [Pleomassaria siparia CBS 279.74]